MESSLGRIEENAVIRVVAINHEGFLTGYFSKETSDKSSWFYSASKIRILQDNYYTGNNYHASVYNDCHYEKNKLYKI